MQRGNRRCGLLLLLPSANARAPPAQAALVRPFELVEGPTKGQARLCRSCACSARARKPLSSALLIKAPAYIAHLVGCPLRRGGRQGASREVASSRCACKSLQALRSRTRTLDNTKTADLCPQERSDTSPCRRRRRKCRHRQQYGCGAAFTLAHALLAPQRPRHA